jgi:hypothetical protein
VLEQCFPSEWVSHEGGSGAWWLTRGIMLVNLASHVQHVQLGAHVHICLAAGTPGEQYTMFFKDLSGNALEFKAMTKPENLFAKA